MQNYIIGTKIGEGSFSEVLRARALDTSDKAAPEVAIKLLRNVSERQKRQNYGPSEQPMEVRILRSLAPHPHIVRCLDAFYDSTQEKFCIVTELMDWNLYDYVQSVYDGRALPERVVRFLMWQALLGVAHVHSLGLSHRDIKPENFLLSNKCNKYYPMLKLADFGGCRDMTSPPPYTEYIATRWYRAPECLLTEGFYSAKMDIWSIGCVMYELMSSHPLFPGRNELSQIHTIDRLLGPIPTYRNSGRAASCEFHQSLLLGSQSQLRFGKLQANAFNRFRRLLSHASHGAISLLVKMLATNPDSRISADAALLHSFFDELRTPPLSLSLLPTGAVFGSTCVAGCNKTGISKLNVCKGLKSRAVSCTSGRFFSYCRWKQKAHKEASPIARWSFCKEEIRKKELMSTLQGSVKSFNCSRRLLLSARCQTSDSKNTPPKCQVPHSKCLSSMEFSGLFDTQTTAPSEGCDREGTDAEDTPRTSMVSSNDEFDECYSESISPQGAQEIAVLREILMPNAVQGTSDSCVPVDQSNASPQTFKNASLRTRLPQKTGYRKVRCLGKVQRWRHNKDKKWKCLGPKMKAVLHACVCPIAKTDCFHRVLRRFQLSNLCR